MPQNPLYIRYYRKSVPNSDKTVQASRLAEGLERKFPGKVYFKGSNFTSNDPYPRYIQLYTPMKEEVPYFHYEYIEGYWELHFEGEIIVTRADLLQYLLDCITEDGRKEYRFLIGQNGTRIIRYDDFISETDGTEKLSKNFKDIIEYLDPKISSFNEIEKRNSLFIPDEPELAIKAESVELYTMSLRQVLSLPLDIPSYQRIYCWGKKNISTLWDDISRINLGDKYRTGTLILHKHESNFDIVDGQQRLVTLSLILNELHKEGISLLDKKYCSSEAEAYISFNKNFIHTLLYHASSYRNRSQLADKILDGVEFSVLILESDSMDLAYTFFSNENSRGKELSDFDLLKAHHLRYIADNEEQSMHIARRWDHMLLEGDLEPKSERKYERALALYVFRLRKWIRMETWSEFDKYNVKTEFEAAKVIDAIPAFGEQFDWNESIQGGPHFFGLVNKFVDQFTNFRETKEYKAIHKLSYHTQTWFRDVIETFLFGYYLKFGTQYLSDALYLISAYVSHSRYKKDRARKSYILEEARNSGIVMKIDRATSPTFFLAEMLTSIKEIEPLANQIYDSGVKSAYKGKLNECLGECLSGVEISEIKSLFF